LIEFTQMVADGEDLWWYRAEFTSLYDADTMTFDIDLGFGCWMRNQKVRLWGIDAWEMRGPERERGLLAKKYATSMLTHRTRGIRRTMLRSYKDKSGKYGRWLAEVFVLHHVKPPFTDRGGTVHPDPQEAWLNVNEALVLSSHAKRATY